MRERSPCGCGRTVSIDKPGLRFGGDGVADIPREVANIPRGVADTLRRVIVLRGVAAMLREAYVRFEGEGEGVGGSLCLQLSTRPVVPEWTFSVSNGSIARDRFNLGQ